MVIFICLICATVKVAPEPLALGSSALSKLEQRLYTYGKTNLYELLETVESWEAKVLKVGAGAWRRAVCCHGLLARVSAWWDVWTGSLANPTPPSFSPPSYV